MTAPLLDTGGYLCLELLAFFGICIQIVQVAMAVSMRPRGQRALPVAWSLCVIAHLALAADVITLLDWQQAPLVVAAMSTEKILPFCWANAALVLLAFVLACAVGERLLWVMAALMLLAVPPVMNALGPWWNLAAFINLAGFLVAGAAQVWREYQHRHEEPTYASIAEAMNVISVGMLVTDGSGGSLFMNDAMRSQLEALNFPTDLGDLSPILERVQDHVVTLADLGVHDDVVPSPPAVEGDSAQILVDMGDGHVLMALIERPQGPRRGTRVFSVDITPLIEAAQRLSAANDALEQANTELDRRLSDVRAISRQAAFLRMRATVHDVIGQRLSILQRYLDAGKIDEESVSRLRALMDSILHDLRDSTGTNPDESLEDVVDAFALVDVDVVVDGSLPDDQEASAALVKVVREACTNACQHAQARTVWVSLGRKEDDGRLQATLEIHDDGMPTTVDGGAGDDAHREGTGIPGMRRAVENLGGTLTVRNGPPFTIIARIPLS